MKRAMVVVTGVLVLLIAPDVLGQSAETSSVHAQTFHGLPASLDNYYPPKAQGPVWLLTMLKMSTMFSGMVADFMEGDFDNAEHDYADFRNQFREVSQMVPEWTGEFQAEPIDALGAALKSRDPAVFMPAVDRAAAVCHACHVKNMTLVQQKYHWDEFPGITVADPVSKSDMPFTIFMRTLDADLSGAQVDLAQGQADRAREHATALAARYQALGEACWACHDTERAYYVDASITGMIDQLGTALAASPPDPATVQKLLEGIGTESCHKCHLVHGPAALSRYTIE